MKVNLGLVLLDKKGKPVMLDKENEATLGDFAFMALNTLTTDEQNLDRGKRMLRGRLAQRVVAAGTGEIDLKSEEVTMIKDSVGKLFDPWTVVQIEDMVEPPIQETKEVNQ